MEYVKLRSTLEMATNMAVLLLAITTLSCFAYIVVTRRSAPITQIGLAKGMRLPPLGNVNFSGVASTLVLVLDTNCVHCGDSLPFYKRLAEMQHRDNLSVHIVAVFPNEERVAAAYLRENQLSLDQSAKTDIGSLKVSGTPTIILVNNNGEIREFWVGKLSNRDEERVIESVLATKL